MSLITDRSSIQKPEFSIIIANWNGEGILPRCLSSLDHAAQRSSRPYEIIVVDDASTDKSVKIMKERFPEVILHQNKRNKGFGSTINKGVLLAHSNLVILCNNDLIADEKFITALLEAFEAGGDQIFGVTARTVDWKSSSANHLNMTGKWKGGWLQLNWDDSKEVHPTHFIQAGACLLRKDIYLQLGGMSRLFQPGYWEDYDLSYKALKSGWVNAYSPQALAFHLGQHSMRRKLGITRLRRLKLRNELLWHWVNITDNGLLLTHCLFLPLKLMKKVKNEGGTTVLAAFWQAIKLLPDIGKERRKRLNSHKLSDTQSLKFHGEEQ